MNPRCWILAAGLCLAPSALAAEGPRPVFEYLDAGGERHYTSDPEAALAGAPDPAEPAGQEEPFADEEAAVALTLEQYVAAYSTPRIGPADLTFQLDLERPAGSPPPATREQMRRSVKRAEFFVILERMLSAEQERSLRERLPLLVFPVLRSIYPGAYLSVILHDGVRTLDRVDWDPAQSEPTVLVR